MIQHVEEKGLSLQLDMAFWSHLQTSIQGQVTQKSTELDKKTENQNTLNAYI